MIELNKKNLSKQWQLINQILQRGHRVKKPLTKLITEKNETLTDNEDISNELNNFFSTCFCAADFHIVSLLTLQGHRNPTIRLSAKTVEDILSKFIQNNSKIQYCQFKRSNAIPISAYKFRHTKLANRFKSPENLS